MHDNGSDSRNTSSEEIFHQSGRPSDIRRETLVRQDSKRTSQILVSGLIPIERYYAASDKVLKAFQSSFEKGDLDNAYIFGKRFAKFSTEQLPTHDFYKSSELRLRRLRMKNIDDLRKVIDGLEYITALMDMEEIDGAKKEGREDSIIRTCLGNDFEVDAWNYSVIRVKGIKEDKVQSQSKSFSELYTKPKEMEYQQFPAIEQIILQM